MCEIFNYLLDKSLRKIFLNPFYQEKIKWIAPLAVSLTAQL